MPDKKFLSGQLTQAIVDGKLDQFVKDHAVDMHGINLQQLIAALQLFCEADTVFVTVACPIIMGL